MAGRTVEARLVITGQDRGAKAALDGVAKAAAGVARAGKATAEVKRLTDQLGKLDAAAKAAERVRAAGEAAAAASMAFRLAQGRTSALAKELDAARAAAARFEATKGAAKGGVMAKEAAEAAARVNELSTKLKAAQRDLRGTSSAMAAQASAASAARSAMNALGVPVSSMSGHQRSLKSSIDATTQAIERQTRADQRAAEVKKLTVQRRAEAQARAEKLEREVSSRREARRDGYRTAAGIVGIGAVHKAQHFGRHALHTYQEFDNERRFGKAVMGLTDEEQKPLVDQAIHMGATTRYNDIQVLEAQRELAARGLKKDQVMGLIPAATDLGQSTGLDLPAAVKQMEGAIFGFKKDISTLDAAVASARQTADVQVKAAKISGMDPEDIKQAYKYGATSAVMSGVSEQTLLAFAGISKKANMDGQESGTAFRALIASTTAPTRKAKEAMLANGLDFKNYQKNPEKLALEPFIKSVAAQYGVELDGKAKAGLGKIFSNKKLIADPSKFTPAVMDLLSDTLGGDDAKSKKSIAGLANRYRDHSMKGVDTNALINDLMKKLPGNLALANSIFGSKQGNRIANALGDPKVLRHMIEELLEHSEGYAAKISAERMAGFDGAVRRFQGATTNLETKLGRAWDNDGKGGALTWVTDKAGKLVQSMAEMDNSVVQVGSAMAALGVAFVGVKSIGLLAGGFGLKGSAVALGESAVALNAAATRLSAGGAVSTATTAATAAPAAAVAFGLGGIVVAGGAVAGAYLDSSEATQGGMGTAALTGGETTGQRLIRENREMLERQKTLQGQRDELSQRLDTEKGVAERLRKTYEGRKDTGTEATQADAAARIAKWEAEVKALDAKIKELGDMPIPPPRPPDFTAVKEKAAEAGTEAGRKVGDGLADGVKEKAPEVEEQGRTLFERLKAMFAEGIKIPISLEGGGSEGGGGGMIRKASFGSGDGAGGGGGIGGVGSGALGRVLRGTASSGGGGGGGGRVSSGAPLSARDLRDVDPTVAGYIRESAVRNGIDPNIALRIANSEGLRGTTPNRLTPGDYEGGRPTSFGPFQLHYGRSGGLGNRYTKETGNHASDPQHWKQQIDFALRTARKEGWGAWYGRKGAGIGLRDGIGVVPKGGASAEAGTFPNGAPKVLKPRSMPDAPGAVMPNPLDRRMPQGEGASDRMERAATRMEEASLRTHHTVEVSASRGLVARTKGMTATGTGGVRPNVGVSMPTAERQYDV